MQQQQGQQLQQQQQDLHWQQVNNLLFNITIIMIAIFITGFIN